MNVIINPPTEHDQILAQQAGLGIDDQEEDEEPMGDEQLQEKE